MSTSSRGSSRRGKKLATAACDLCRLRKIQCIFVNESDRRCSRCAAVGLECTFLRGHRPRGRVSRHVAAAREQRKDTPVNGVKSMQGSAPGPVSTNINGTKITENTAPPRLLQTASDSPRFADDSDNLVPNLSVTHLCPLECMELILNDFHDYIYPVLPVVHLPTIMDAINKPLWTDKPANRIVFRTVMAVAAATVASIPRRFAAYSNGKYATVQAMVDRALRLVILSRVVSPTHLDDDRTLESCVTSLVLSLAAFYTGRGGIARNLTNEAVVLFRSLGLYRKEEHKDLSDFDSEICKRLFWMFYINQIHDRLDSIVPHYPLCFEPMETDWEFLIPRENEDEGQFYANSPPDPNATASNRRGIVSLGSPPTPSAQPAASARSRPIVSGFYALLRVYLCVLDNFASDFPRPPPSVLTSLPLSMEPRFLTSVPASEFYVEPSMPLSLAFMNPNNNPNLCLTTGTTLTSVTQLMRRVRTPSMTNLDIIDNTSPKCGHHVSIEAKIWSLRERLASEALDILHQFPQEALEANGASLILKARKIAVTLLERDESFTLSPATATRLDTYLEQFVHSLASIDYLPPNSYSATEDMR
ncbi:hypothetical protein SEUCBS139899_005819 [Sporothrix eucalyptigena]